jgi:hypothetical protein
LEEGKSVSGEMRRWKLWDLVGHYTSLGMKKSIGRGNSFDVHG